MHGPSRWLISLLALSFPGLAKSAETGADAGSTIRLLSDEAADVCIKDPACMRDLFVHAAFGEGDGSQRLFKWSGPANIASFTGGTVADGMKPIVDEQLQQMGLIAGVADSELSQIKGDHGQVVNFVLLISGNFAEDRDTAFSDLLSDVFAGRSALYDKLSSGPSPVCQGHLFANPDGSISGGLALVESDVEGTALRRCLHRAVLNVLGLRHPLPDDVDSVLSPNSERLAWTSIDFMLLRMLNDPDVVQGMDRDGLMSAFPQIHQRALRPAS